MTLPPSGQTQFSKLVIEHVARAGSAPCEIVPSNDAHLKCGWLPILLNETFDAFIYSLYGSCQLGFKGVN